MPVMQCDIVCPLCEGRGELKLYGFLICIACGGNKRLIWPPEEQYKKGWKELSKQELQIIRGCKTPREAQKRLEKQGFHRDYRTLWARMKGAALRQGKLAVENSE